MTISSTLPRSCHVDCSPGHPWDSFARRPEVRHTHANADGVSGLHPIALPLANTTACTPFSRLSTMGTSIQTHEFEHRDTIELHARHSN